MKNLPILDVLDDIKSTFENQSTLILQAPPGAGKSTVVPISLLKESWLEEKMIIMLEPRRVAARMVAIQMAKLLGEEVGQTVGYQVKMDNCYSEQTKLLVVTEAILVRKLQSDPALENVALVIFDEFHERSIHTDLSLALSLQVQELLRDDLKLLIMSATLNTQSLVELLGDVPVITSEGKTFEVENIYLPANIKQPDKQSMNSVLVDITLQALKENTGDILIFLAGAKEIQELQKALEKKVDTTLIELLPLYSALSKDKQDKALLPLKKRKIILSTNIAQTSLTIEGVCVVIDSGLEKLSQYDYSNAMNHLNLSFISNDSALQRAGRAGRLSHGKCYKLWHQGKILQESSKAEILGTDLSSFYLELANWGVKDAKELSLLDYPNESVQNSTKEMLKELHMLNENDEITDVGQKALRLGLHPRFAHMILQANSLGFAYEACLLSAMLEEKDIFKNSHNNSNIYERFMHLYEEHINATFINVFRAKTILKQAQFYFKKLKSIESIGKKQQELTEELLAVLLLFAYPDRLAKQRGKNDHRYKLSNAKGAVIHPEDSLFNEPFLIVPVLNAHHKDSYIQQAMRISLNTIEAAFEQSIQKQESITYNRKSNRLDIKEHYRFYALELYTKPTSSEVQHDYATLFCNLIEKEGLGLLTWSKKAIDLQNRVNFLAQHMQTELPLLDNDSLQQNVQVWLKPYLQDVTSIKVLEALDVYAILLSLIPWELQQQLDSLVPSHIKVPSGSNIKIDYSNPQTAVLAVKIQEVFGLKESPKILNNSMPVQMHLLTPAMRPIQITFDLKSFWDNSYEEVKKELFSKYKKHYWPDNPYEAIATNKTKKNMKKQ